MNRIIKLFGKSALHSTLVEKMDTGRSRSMKPTMTQERAQFALWTILLHFCRLSDFKTHQKSFIKRWKWYCTQRSGRLRYILERNFRNIEKSERTYLIGSGCINSATQGRSNAKLEVMMTKRFLHLRHNIYLQLIYAKTQNFLSFLLLLHEHTCRRLQ